MPLNEQRDEIADWAPVKSSAEGRGRATGTVLAMVAHLRAPYELMWFPISHSDSPEERYWTEFEKRFLDLTLYGLPEAFRRDDARAAPCLFVPIICRNRRLRAALSG